MVDESLSDGISYADELNEVPGEFHELRLVMDKMGCLVKPHPELGFGDESQNTIVRSLKGQTAQEIAHILTRKKLAKAA